MLDKVHPQHQVRGIYSSISTLSRYLDTVSTMRAQVLLLIDKQAYDTQNEVVVYVPTSHVLLHDADMLGLQVTTIHVTRDMTH